MPHKNPLAGAKYKHEWYQRNRSRLLEYAREYRNQPDRKQAHKKLARKHHLWTRYRIDQEQYEELLKKQGGVCKICKNPNPGRRRRYLSVDHDHLTGHVRGLLCHGCNILVSYAENPKLLDAFTYLGVE